MKKVDNKWVMSGIIGILFLVYNIIVFGVIGYQGAQFMMAYLFTIIAFVLFILTIWFVCGKNNKLKDIFLGLPILLEGTAYVAVQTVLSIVFMVLPWEILKISVILQILLASVYAVLVLSSISAKNAISNIDDKVRKKRNYLGFLKIEVEELRLQEEDADVKKALTELSEAIRFSDPMSAEELAGAEEAIMEKVTILSSDYNGISAEEKLSRIQDIKNKISVRNMKCKMLK